METNEISEQALELQIQVLEERNALLEKKIRRLTHRCQALERFYREIVVKQKGYLHPGMNVPVQEAGFNPRVLKRLEEGGMKVLGDLMALNYANDTLPGAQSGRELCHGISAVHVQPSDYCTNHSDAVFVVGGCV